MSLPDQEARALDEAFQFLLDLSGGAEKRIPAATRQRARTIVKHFPLAAGGRWHDLTEPPGDETTTGGRETVANDVTLTGRLEWLDAALCDALAAGRQGEYDRMSVVTHLEQLIARLRADSQSGENDTGDDHQEAPMSPTVENDGPTLGVQHYPLGPAGCLCGTPDCPARAAERDPVLCLCLFEDGVIVRTDDLCELHSNRPGIRRVPAVNQTPTAAVAVEWAVRAENGVTCHASEEVARAVVTEGGYTLGPDRSPIVAALTRRAGTVEWHELAPHTTSSAAPPVEGADQ